MRRSRRRPSIARNSPTPTSRPPAAISTTSSIPATAGRASSKRLRRSPRSATAIPPRSMATFLSSVVLAAALSQAPGGPPAATGPDAIAAAQARLAQDSGDGRAWLALGRAYLTAFDEAQARRARSDSGAPRAALDGAEQALAAEWKLGTRGAGDGWLGALAQRRPVCVSMAFERPPPLRAGMQWEPRPLVWVAGPEQGERVPSGDFVFAALKLALDAHEAWAQAALAVYGRAARLTPTLCETLATYGLSGDQVGCGE